MGGELCWLARFVTREGHARVPRGRADTEADLGNWVGIQRAIFAKGRLDPDRAARLAALPGWTWNVHSDRFEDGFAALAEFVACEGHAKVSSRVKQDGFALGLWVVNRRAEYSAGSSRPSGSALEALPGWTWDPAATLGGALHGPHGVRRSRRSRPSACRSPGGRMCARTLGDIPEESPVDRPPRPRACGAPRGLAWLVLGPAIEQWEEGFAALVRFVEREGHAQVPMRLKENGFAFGHWVSIQRGAFKDGGLDRSAQRGSRGFSTGVGTPSRSGGSEDSRCSRGSLNARVTHACLTTIRSAASPSAVGLALTHNLHERPPQPWANCPTGRAARLVLGHEMGALGRGLRCAQALR